MAIWTYIYVDILYIISSYHSLHTYFSRLQCEKSLTEWRLIWSSVTSYEPCMPPVQNKVIKQLVIADFMHLIWIRLFFGTTHIKPLIGLLTVTEQITGLIVIRYFRCFPNCMPCIALYFTALWHFVRVWKLTERRTGKGSGWGWVTCDKDLNVLHWMPRHQLKGD